MELRTFTFVTPTGFEYTIREQNGNDEDILSNPRDMVDLTNLSKFIAAIVVKTNFTANGKLTLEDVLNMPLNDRYCILIQSRIFSLGEILEFSYEWKNPVTGKTNKVEYEQDLNEFLFDYSQEPTEEELDSKPDAIPYYPLRSQVTFEHTLASGKNIMFNLLTVGGEKQIFKLPLDKQTRNSLLTARNLQLEVDGKWERVESFHLFSVKDMVEIRKLVATYDPQFKAETDIVNPNTGETLRYNIMTAPTFFFLAEA